jgi:hypothetical protein
MKSIAEMIGMKPSDELYLLPLRETRQSVEPDVPDHYRWPA